MVENQHRKIQGYRDLTEEEIALMNEGKVLEAQVLGWLDKVKAGAADPRWSAIGCTQIELGFMAAQRSIAKPKRL